MSVMEMLPFFGPPHPAENPKKQRMAIFFGKNLIGQ
jgi:hypothetical protein